MPTINQLVRHSRQPVIKKTKAPALRFRFNGIGKASRNFVRARDGRADDHGECACRHCRACFGRRPDAAFGNDGNFYGAS